MKPIEWLKAHVNHEGDDCLIWPFDRNHYGYPRVTENKVRYVATRVMLREKTGQMPAHLHAAHTCGNGAGGCINPRHLEWKDRKANEADKLRHGTSNRGPRNGMAKMSEHDAMHVLGMLRAGYHPIEIAMFMGVSPSAIKQIKNGYNWKHLSHSDAPEAPST